MPRRQQQRITVTDKEAVNPVTAALAGALGGGGIGYVSADLVGASPLNSLIYAGLGAAPGAASGYTIAKMKNRIEELARVKNKVDTLARQMKTIEATPAVQEARKDTEAAKALDEGKIVNRKAGFEAGVDRFTKEAGLTPEQAEQFKQAMYSAYGSLPPGSAAYADTQPDQAGPDGTDSGQTMWDRVRSRMSPEYVAQQTPQDIADMMAGERSFQRGDQFLSGDEYRSNNAAIESASGQPATRQQTARDMILNRLDQGYYNRNSPNYLGGTPYVSADQQQLINSRPAPAVYNPALSPSHTNQPPYVSVGTPGSPENIAGANKYLASIGYFAPDVAARYGQTPTATAASQPGVVPDTQAAAAAWHAKNDARLAAASAARANPKAVAKAPTVAPAATAPSTKKVSSMVTENFKAGIEKFAKESQMTPEQTKEFTELVIKVAEEYEQVVKTATEEVQ